MVDWARMLGVMIRGAPELVQLVDVLSLLCALPFIGLLNDFFNRDRSEDRNRSRDAKLTDRERILLRQLQQFRSLLQMAGSLSATLNYERVLEMTLDLAYGVLEEPGMPSSEVVSALLLFSQDRLFFAAARGLTHADMRSEFPGEAGVIAEALNRGETRMVTNPSSDPELQRLVGLHRCKVAVCIPLIVGLEAYGLLLFAHPNEDYFTNGTLEILQAVANQAIIALQNAQLYRDLEQEKERIIEIQEETRKKLARDLHDGPTQSVGAIAMRVNFARRLLTRDTDAAGEELFKIEELARRTTKEIRQMLFTLRPLVLESEGLVPALEQLAEKMQENHNQKVIVEADPSAVEDMEVGKQGVIFFIVDEAVNNARKHARASQIIVRLERQGELLNLQVEDDGVGFDLGAVEDNYNQRGSLGMVNLRERAELVNGLLRIDTAKGKGTRIYVTIPMTLEAAEKLHRTGFVQ